MKHFVGNFLTQIVKQGKAKLEFKFQWDIHKR
jgi:hypothetical protein